jgi:hypothetical protein
MICGGLRRTQEIVKFIDRDPQTCCRLSPLSSAGFIKLPQVRELVPVDPASGVWINLFQFLGRQS